jgi:hypothetical protein
MQLDKWERKNGGVKDGSFMLGIVCVYLFYNYFIIQFIVSLRIVVCYSVMIFLKLSLGSLSVFIAQNVR